MRSDLRQEITQARETAEPQYTCATCKDQGMVLHEAEGGRKRWAEVCECRRRAALEQSLRRAGLPQRYAEASLANYNARASHAANVGQQAAHRYIAAWPLTDYPGILFTGTVGTGKTHLAVAILRELVSRRGAACRFVDFGSLLKQLRASYGESGYLDEAEILQPILQCDVLALDEIGAEKASDWTHTVIEHILNTRYNENRSTIITTNLPFRAPAAARTYSTDRSMPMPQLTESLGDRIGMRMFSRLQEMCEVVEMNGEDYRARARRRQA